DSLRKRFSNALLWYNALQDLSVQHIDNVLEQKRQFLTQDALDEKDDGFDGPDPFSSPCLRRTFIDDDNDSTPTSSTPTSSTPTPSTPTSPPPQTPRLENAIPDSPKPPPQTPVRRSSSKRRRDDEEREDEEDMEDEVVNPFPDP
ncbi:hypothetical protein H0H92_014624, partial [Tricholoma furcatifolium]